MVERQGEIGAQGGAPARGAGQLAPAQFAPVAIAYHRPKVPDLSSRDFSSYNLELFGFLLVYLYDSMGGWKPCKTADNGKKRRHLWKMLLSAALAALLTGAALPRAGGGGSAAAQLGPGDPGRQASTLDLDTECYTSFHGERQGTDPPATPSGPSLLGGEEGSRRPSALEASTIVEHRLDTPEAEPSPRIPCPPFPLERSGRGPCPPAQAFPGPGAGPHVRVSHAGGRPAAPDQLDSDSLPFSGSVPPRPAFSAALLS